MKHYNKVTVRIFLFLSLNNIAAVRLPERSITSFSILFCYIFEKLSIIQFLGRIKTIIWKRGKSPFTF